MMKRVLKYMFAVLVVAVVATSCREKFEWSIPLAVNSTEITRLDVNGGHQYVTVFSTGDWSCRLLPVVEGDDISWCRLVNTTGTGCQAIDMEFDLNETGYTRSVVLEITGEGETISVRITQNKE